jgi:hypothetical protein
MNIRLNLTNGVAEEMPLIVNGVHVADIAVSAYEKDGLPAVYVNVTGYIVAEDDNATNVCEIDSQTFQRKGWIITQEQVTNILRRSTEPGILAWRNA